MMKTIITIGRQFGSGGKEIGIRVAKELGIPFYDKELLQEAAKKSGLCEKIFENFDERPKSLLYSIAMDSYMFALPGTGAGDSLEQQVYLATFNTIRHIADQGPCVIIGRCADYALAENPNHLSLFIYAPLEVRIKRVAQRQNIPEDKAECIALCERYGLIRTGGTDFHGANSAHPHPVGTCTTADEQIARLTELARQRHGGVL